MIDHVGMEVGDIAQVSTLGFPKAEPEAPLVSLGIGTVDTSKPVIMCIGHNVIPSVGIIDYMKDNNLADKIEVVGLCCTAHDITRYYQPRQESSVQSPGNYASSEADSQT